MTRDYNMYSRAGILKEGFTGKWPIAGVSTLRIQRIPHATLHRVYHLPLKSPEEALDMGSLGQQMIQHIPIHNLGLVFGPD